MADPALRAAIRDGELVLAPGVFDLISALIADRMAFRALYITGYGAVASHLGLPDAGLATYRDMLERVAQIAKMTTRPIIADADTGYGGLLNVRETVRGYEAAGASAIQIEDQEFPKRCGHTPGRAVIPLPDMLRKIEVALDSRRSEDFLLIARTDARSALGLDEAIRRGRAFAEAGADVVFVESPESEEEMRCVRDAIEGSLLANMVNGGLTPMLPADRLRGMGYAVVLHPAVGFLAAGAALQRAYGDLLDHGETSRDVELYPFEAFHDLLGFEDVWAFERRYADR